MAAEHSFIHEVVQDDFVLVERVAIREPSVVAKLKRTRQKVALS